MCTGATATIRLVLVLCLLSGASFSLPHGQHINDHVTRVIAGVKHHLHADCVNLITSRDLDSNDAVLRVQKTLSGRSVSTTVVNASAILDGAHSLLDSCNTPMCALLADDSDTTQVLKLLADSKKLSGKIWLLFLPSSLEEEFFVGIDIPFDCEFIVATGSGRDRKIELSEVYRVAAGSPLQRYDVGSWGDDLGLAWAAGSLHDRRRNLGGLVFRTSVNEWAPYALVRGATLDGFAGNVWSILERHLHFSSAHRVPGDGLWGTRHANGSWDGIIGAVVRRDADMSAVGMTMTPERADDVRFTTPLFIHNMVVYIREPERRVSMWDLASPLRPTLWAALLLSAVTSSLVLGVAYDETDAAFNVFAAVFCMQGLLGGDARPRTTALSASIVTFLVYVTGVVFLNAYSSFVTSSLTTHRPEMPFESIDALLLDGTYSLGMLSVGYPYSVFKHAQHPLLKQLYNKHVAPDPDNLQLNNADAFRRVCTRRYAFVIGEEAPATVRRLNCSVVGLRNRFSEFRNCFAFPRDSPYVGVFNSQLLSLINSGVLRKLHRDAVRAPPHAGEEGPSPAGLNTVAPMMTVLAAGVLASSLLLAIEVLTARL